MIANGPHIKGILNQVMGWPFQTQPANQLLTQLDDLRLEGDNILTFRLGLE